jgi:hypothetical protein
MKSASGRLISELDKDPATAHSEESAGAHLHFVASTFIKIHQNREEADYNTSFEWARIDVLNLIDAVSKAFGRWELVREDPRAQRYLVSLLLKKEH